MNENEISDEKVRELFEKIGTGQESIAGLRGITPDELESVYALAYNFYTVGDWKKAETLFRFLATMDHRDDKYWMGLGAALQAQRDWQGALVVYAHICTALNIRNVKASWHAAECLCRLGNKAGAQSAVAHVRRYANPDTDGGREALQAVAKLCEERGLDHVDQG